MAKLAFFAAVLVALVVLSAAEGANTLQQQCQRQLKESSLNACRQVVDQQVAVQLPFFAPRSSQLGTGVRMQCCQQLRDISRECRAAAIRQIVRQYEHQAVVPLREDPYYPGEDEEQQGGTYYPGEDEEQQGGSYYPGETYPQQEQGWEQQQQEQWWYGPSQTYRPEQQEQGWYGPSQTYCPEQQGQGWYGPSQTYRPEQQEQGWYRPSQTYRPQQQQQGWYGPSQTYRPEQQEQGSFYPSETFPQQQQGEGSFGKAQQQKGRQDPHRLHITIYSPARQQQEGQAQYCGRQGQQTGFGRFSSPPHFGTDQQARLRLVARARQVAAQLPAMCRLEGTAFSGGQY